MKKEAFDRVVDYLARRDHSELELRQKLGRYDHSPREIEAAIAEAWERRYLLDPNELSGKVAESLHRKNKGQYYIQNYLRNKGLPEVQIDPELEIQKALAIVAGHSDRDKIARKLANRGFAVETIRKVIYEEL